MTRTIPALAALALGTSLLLTGCESGYSSSCWGGECHVTVNGTGGLLDIGEYYVKVTEISDGWAAISIDRSRPVRIAVGQTARVNGATVKVTSIKGDTVKFDLE